MKLSHERFGGGRQKLLQSSSAAAVQKERAGGTSLPRPLKVKEELRKLVACCCETV